MKHFLSVSQRRHVDPGHLDSFHQDPSSSNRFSCYVSTALCLQWTNLCSSTWNMRIREVIRVVDSQLGILRLIIISLYFKSYYDQELSNYFFIKVFKIFLCHHNKIIFITIICPMDVTDLISFSSAHSVHTFSQLSGNLLQTRLYLIWIVKAEPCGEGSDSAKWWSHSALDIFRSILQGVSLIVLTLTWDFDMMWAIKPSCSPSWSMPKSSYGLKCENGFFSCHMIHFI